MKQEQEIYELCVALRPEFTESVSHDNNKNPKSTIIGFGPSLRQLFEYCGANASIEVWHKDANNQPVVGYAIVRTTDANLQGKLQQQDFVQDLCPEFDVGGVAPLGQVRILPDRAPL